MSVSTVTRPRVPGAKAESLQIVNIVFIHIQSKGCQGRTAQVLGWSVRALNSLTNNELFIEFQIIQRTLDLFFPNLPQRIRSVVLRNVQFTAVRYCG